MAQLRQTSFARGELSPLLWGRSDLELYGAGLRRCRDFFPTKQGALMTRPGTIHLANAHPPGCLVPFVFSDDFSYVLHFKAGGVTGSIVIYRNGTQVATVASSPYNTDSFELLRFVQSGNVLTLVCRGHVPRTLTRESDTVWTLADIDFERPAAGVVTPKVVAPLPTADTEHPARNWKLLVTELRRDARGVPYESAPHQLTQDDSGVDLPDQLVIYPDKPLTLRLNYLNHYPKASDPNFLAYIVYRGDGGQYGLIGHTENWEFIDVGDEPNYAKAPPEGRAPFVTYETPRSVAYFEERLVFGGTGAAHTSADAKAAANRLLLSATGEYTNFDERLIPIATQALMYELASRKWEEIRHLLALHQLLVFTSSSVWAFGGAEPLDATVVPFARVQEEVGSTQVPPLSIEGAALYVRTKGAGVRALRYERDRLGFVGQDLSSVADHFFQSATEDCEIVSWCYAEDPWGVIWAARADGKVLSLTYSPIDNAWGWALHDFGGQVLSLCSVPEGDEDVVYMVVKRENVYGSSGYFSFERLASRVQKGDVNDDICVDFAHKYEGPPVQTITGVTAFRNRDDIWVVGKGFAPVKCSVDGAGELELPVLPEANSGTDVVLWIGLLYQPELELLDAAPGSVRAQQKRVTEVVFEVDSSRGLKVGGDFDHLREWRQRTVAASYGLPSSATEVVRTPIESAWNLGGRAALRQTLPLPLTIVGLTRELNVGG